MLDQIKSILWRSFVISLIFLLLAYNVYSLFPNAILSLVHQFFGVSTKVAEDTIFNFYCAIKVIAVWLFIVPALAIGWYQIDAKRKAEEKQKAEPKRKTPAKKKK